MAEEKNKKSTEPFIKEKIAGPNPKKKRRKIVFVLGLSVLAGVLAALAFFLTLWLLPDPRDKESETQETPMETTPPETESSQPEETETFVEVTPNIEDLVDAYLDENAPGVTTIIEYARKIYQEVSKSLVDVVITRTDTDWMFHTYEQGGVLQGGIVKMQGGYLYVLVRASDLAGAEKVQVTIANQLCDAELYASDQATDMQLLRVNVAEFSKNELERYQEITFEDYTLADTGDFVMAVGNPLGVADSMDFGFVSYRGKTTESVDAHYQILYTDMMAYEGSSGFFVDAEGRIIGWITDQYKEEQLSHSLAAISCSNVAHVVEGMLANSTIGYLGVVTQDVTEAQAGQLGVAQGVYITQALTEGPAFLAGIQNGDVIIRCDGDPVNNTRMLQNMLAETNAGKTCTVTVLRWSRDAYKEVEVTVSLARRP